MSWILFALLVGAFWWMHGVMIELREIASVLKRVESELVGLNSTLHTVELQTSLTADNTDVLAREVKRNSEPIF